jgi:hypothetical protein
LFFGRQNTLVDPHDSSKPLASLSHDPLAQVGRPLLSFLSCCLLILSSLSDQERNQQQQHFILFILFFLLLLFFFF